MGAFRERLELSTEVYKFHIQLDYRSAEDIDKMGKGNESFRDSERWKQKNNGILIKQKVVTFFAFGFDLARNKF